MRPLKVVVIGGGIAGVSAAYHLALSGADVTLLEQETTLAFHSTGRSAALYFENYEGSQQAADRASGASSTTRLRAWSITCCWGSEGSVGPADRSSESLDELLDEGTRRGGSARWLET